MSHTLNRRAVLAGATLAAVPALPAVAAEPANPVQYHWRKLCEALAELSPADASSIVIHGAWKPGGHPWMQAKAYRVREEEIRPGLVLPVDCDAAEFWLYGEVGLVEAKI